MKPKELAGKALDILFSASFATLILAFFVILLSLTAGLFLFLDFVQPPDPNIGNYYYESTEDYTPHGLPINLTDFGVEVKEYYYRKAGGVSLPFIDQSTYRDSLADSVENPTQVVTLAYDIWESSVPFLLDRTEKSLQRKYGRDIIEAELDYGAQKAYWAGKSLVLRYDGRVVCFYGDSSEELLKTEACAAYMREFAEYKKTGPF